MLKSRLVVVLVCSAQLAACTSPESIKRRIASYEANNPTMNPTDVAGFAGQQNKVMLEFARMAGAVSSDTSDIDALLNIREWRAVVDAGVHYTDVRCDKFMDALFWFNRVREGTSRQIQYTGAAAGAALAALEASKTAIGLTPLGFSLLDQTVNNLGAGLLFNLNPSTVRVLVERKQTAYVRALSPSYTSRVVALQVIQNYAAICLPPSIETEVERAISSQEYDPEQVHSPLPNSAADTTPDPFQFNDVIDVALAADIDSGPVTVTGFTGPVLITVKDGSYSIDGGAWTTAAGAISSGSTVKLRVKSSGAFNKPTSASVNIGGVEASFKVTTKAVAGAAVTPQVVDAAPAPAEVPEAPGISEPLDNSRAVNGLPNPTPKD